MGLSLNGRILLLGGKCVQGCLKCPWLRGGTPIATWVCLMNPPNWFSMDPRQTNKKRKEKKRRRKKSEQGQPSRSHLTFGFCHRRVLFRFTGTRKKRRLLLLGSPILAKTYLRRRMQDLFGRTLFRSLLRKIPRNHLLPPPKPPQNPPKTRRPDFPDAESRFCGCLKPRHGQRQVLTNSRRVHRAARLGRTSMFGEPLLGDSPNSPQGKGGCGQD